MIDLDLALRVAHRRADRHGYELILPGDVRRDAVLYGLAGVHALTGHGWSLDHAREAVSVTLPGLGTAVEALRAVPVVGPLLADAFGGVRRPMVLLSPAALASGGALLATLAHEEGHIGDLRRGGLLWCVAYGLVPEARVGAEAPCYGAGSIALRHAIDGGDLDTLAANAVLSLTAYGVEGADLDFARAVIASNVAGLRRGADPGGVLADFTADLRAEGWSP